MNNAFGNLFDVLHATVAPSRVGIADVKKLVSRKEDLVDLVDV